MRASTISATVPENEVNERTGGPPGFTNVLVIEKRAWRVAEELAQHSGARAVQTRGAPRPTPDTAL